MPKFLSHRSGRRVRGLLAAGAMPWALAALAAALTALFDPTSGRRRRARLRDRVVHGSRVASNAARVSARDLAHRTQGAVARASSALAADVANDDVIAARARAHLGRVCSHARAVCVDVQSGRLVLTGAILAREHAQTVREMGRLHGVSEVVDHLEVHEHPASVPSLQGGVTRTGQRMDLRQQQWAPTTRVAVGVLGSGMVFYGLRRATRSWPSVVIGSALVARAAANQELKDIAGIGRKRDVIAWAKSIHIAAPVEDVFASFERLESFPRFMTHVCGVEERTPGQVRFTVRGPARIPLHWDAVVTKRVVPQVIAWRSADGSWLRNAGQLRFEQAHDGTTLVHVRVGYSPPGGLLSHALASLFGHNPKTMLDEELLRLKSLIEDGQVTGRQGRVTRAEIESGTGYREMSRAR